MRSVKVSGSFKSMPHVSFRQPTLVEVSVEIARVGEMATQMAAPTLRIEFWKIVPKACVPTSNPLVDCNRGVNISKTCVAETADSIKYVLAACFFE